MDVNNSEERVSKKEQLLLEFFHGIATIACALMKIFRFKTS
jgi:hypothetical protein